MNATDSSAERILARAPAPRSELNSRDGLAGLFSHYWQALVFRRRLALALVMLTTLGTFAVSVVTLYTSPKYTATAIISMLPSDPALQFTRGWLGRSQVDPVTISTNTHLEYLYSRPVIEEALDLVLARYVPPATNPESWRARLREMVSELRGFLWETYQRLNYGRAEEGSTLRDQQITMLQSGVEITAMQGSYILLVEASLPDPHLAALTANAIAEAYIAHATRESAATAQTLAAFIEKEISRRYVDIEQIDRSVQQLARELEGMNAGGADAAIRTLTGERLRLRAAERALSAANDSTQQEVAKAEVDRLSSAVIRTQKWLDALDENAQARAGLERRRADIELDLEELRDRLLTMNLATADEIDRVSVIEPATTPPLPSSPKVFNYTVAGAILGVILAVMLVIATEIYSDKVTTPAHLKRIAGNAALGAIPREGRQLLRPAFMRNRALRALGEEIDARMTSFGDISAIAVTTLGSASVAESNARALGAALAYGGRTVTFAENCQAGAQTGSEPSGASVTRVITSGRYGPNHWRIADGAATLCLVTRGRTSEAALGEFMNEAAIHSDWPVWVALVEDA